MSNAVYIKISAKNRGKIYPDNVTQSLEQIVKELFGDALRVEVPDGLCVGY